MSSNKRKSPEDAKVDDANDEAKPEEKAEAAEAAAEVTAKKRKVEDAKDATEDTAKKAKKDTAKKAKKDTAKKAKKAMAALAALKDLSELKGSKDLRDKIVLLKPYQYDIFVTREVLAVLAVELPTTTNDRTLCQWVLLCEKGVLTTNSRIWVTRTSDGFLAKPQKQIGRSMFGFLRSLRKDEKALFYRGRQDPVTGQRSPSWIDYMAEHSP